MLILSLVFLSLPPLFLVYSDFLSAVRFLFLNCLRFDLTLRWPKIVTYHIGVTGTYTP